MRLALHRFIRSRPHLSLAIVLGCIVAPLLPAVWTPITRLLAAWDIAVWAYLLTMGWSMARAGHRKVKDMAARQDERAGLVLATLSAAAFMSLAAILSQLPTLKGMPLDQRVLHYAFTALTLLGSWLLVGTLFCFHYAHLYYQIGAAEPPLQFPDSKLEPAYSDFLYFSFTVAMTAQTSDITVPSGRMRKVVLAQAVLSFFFNLVVLGLSINIAAGLVAG